MITVSSSSGNSAGVIILDFFGSCCCLLFPSSIIMLTNYVVWVDFRQLPKLLQLLLLQRLLAPLDIKSQDNEGRPLKALTACEGFLYPSIPPSFFARGYYCWYVILSPFLQLPSQRFFNQPGGSFCSCCCCCCCCCYRCCSCLPTQGRMSFVFCF